LGARPDTAGISLLAAISNHHVWWPEESAVASVA
jgi:hypothetical protein